MGTRSSAVALFVLALVVFGVQSTFLPAFPGRDLGRYVQTFIQLGYHTPVLTSVLDTRGPLAALGVGAPLELGGWAAEVMLATLYALSLVAWGAVAMAFGARTAILTTGLLLVYPAYGILFHSLAGDSLFTAAFAGWAYLLTRAVLRPSIGAFLVAGLGMGTLVLARPSNQVLIVVTLLPLLLRATWKSRLQWMIAFFVASALVTQGWRVLAAWRYGDTVSLQPSRPVLAATLLLVLVLAALVWRPRVALLAIPLLLAVVVVRGLSSQNPVQDLRMIAQIPSGNVYLFRAFEIDPIMSPDNGPASRRLAHVVQRELLTKEPYRSYGVDLHTVFSSGSDRIFGDLTSLTGVDLAAATNEAIRRHPRTFATGIARTLWDEMFVRRVYTPEATTADDSTATSESGGTSYVVIKGRKLPQPTGGQPIPASRVGPVLTTVAGPAVEVWRSATDHSFVFADALDARRYARFQSDTSRLTDRIPTRAADASLVHRFNQASHVFPPIGFWLLFGAIAIAIRRPARSLIAVSLTVAALVVIVSTSLIAFAVAEYAAPVSPAFILLVAAGLVGAGPSGRFRLPFSQRVL